MAEASVQLNQNQQQIFNNYLRSQGLNVNDVLNTPSQPFQPTQTTTPEINAGDIGNVSPIQLPQEATRIQSVSGILSQLQGLTSGVADDSTQTALEQSLLGLTAGLEGQTEFKAQTSEELGIPEIEQQIADVSGQALRRASLLQEQIVGMEGQGAFAATTRGREARAIRQASAEIQGLQATQEILRGNLEVAQSKLDQAVSLKYDPIKERIQTLTTAIEFNKERMTREEKKLAEKREVELFAIQQNLERAQTIENASLNEIISASRLGMSSGKASQLISGVINGSIDPSKAIAQAGFYTGQMERLQIQKLQQEVNAYTNKGIKQTLTGIINNGYKLTGDEDHKVGGFAKRMHDSYQIIKQLTEEGVDIRPQAVADGRFFGKSSKEKQLITAYRDFIAAKLRLESGAAITLDEHLGEAISLVNRPQDNDQTRNIKNTAMENSLNSTINESQGGFEYLLSQDILTQAQTGTTDVVGFVIDARAIGGKEEEIRSVLIENFPEEEEFINRALGMGYTLEEVALTLSEALQ